MRRKAPGVPFIGFVSVVCIYVLGMSWIIGVGLAYQFIALLLMAVAVVAITVRAILALWAPLRTDTAFVVRLGVPPVLFAVTIALMFGSVPEKLRLALSKDALDAYAQTVTATECDHASDQERRVGLYTVTCAYRYDDKTLLVVEDGLTDSGLWYLVGPGSWKLALED
jgi:hypothetical protein